MLLNSSAGAAFSANDTALITAVFDYHILNGTHYESDITSKAQFIPTMLMEGQYSALNDQVVEAIKSDNSTLFYSGLLQNSTVTQAVGLPGEKSTSFR